MSVNPRASFVLALVMLAACSPIEGSASESASDGAEVSSAIRPLPKNEIQGYEKRAQSGDMDAAFALYSHYSYLEYTNRIDASSWLEKAADNGHLGAMQRFVMDEVSAGRCENAKQKFSEYASRIKALNEASLSEVKLALAECEKRLLAN